MENIIFSHHHTTSAHPTHTPCIAAKLLSPQTYYPIRQITIFHQNSVVCPILTNRTVKPHIPIYSALRDIETTHSTCVECAIQIPQKQNLLLAEQKF